MLQITSSFWWIESLQLTCLMDIANLAVPFSKPQLSQHLHYLHCRTLKKRVRVCVCFVFNDTPQCNMCFIVYVTGYLGRLGELGTNTS